MYCSSQDSSVAFKSALCWAACLQLDQHVLWVRKDKHISPPVSNCGGYVPPISSLILKLAGRRVCKAALGCVLMRAVHARCIWGPG